MLSYNKKADLQDSLNTLLVRKYISRNEKGQMQETEDSGEIKEQKKEERCRG